MLSASFRVKACQILNATDKKRWRVRGDGGVIGDEQFIDWVILSHFFRLMPLARSWGCYEPSEKKLRIQGLLRRCQLTMNEEFNVITASICFTLRSSRLITAQYRRLNVLRSKAFNR